MSAQTPCEMTLLVQADFDGELDASQAATVEAHRHACPVCRAAYEDFQRVRENLREGDLYSPAPDTLRHAVTARVASARPASLGPRATPWGRNAASFGVGAAAAAMIAFLVIRPAPTGLIDEVVSDHVRSLQPGHLMDVISTDRHTVKPWFDGRLDFAPPVKDLGEHGFPLEGARLDYLNGRPVAALVYSRAKHQINLFLWPVDRADSAMQVAERNGYNAIHFTHGGMSGWVVSDLEKGELTEFVTLWQQMP